MYIQYYSKSQSTHALNLTVDRKYWNRMRNCTSTDRRKLESDSCSVSSLGFVRNFAKKCCDSRTVSTSISMPLLLFSWSMLPRGSSSLKLVKAASTLDAC